MKTNLKNDFSAYLYYLGFFSLPNTIDGIRKTELTILCHQNKKEFQQLYSIKKQYFCSCLIDILNPKPL